MAVDRTASSFEHLLRAATHLNLTLLPLPYAASTNTDADDTWDVERIAANSCLCALEKACVSRVEKSLEEFNLPMPSQEHEDFYRDIISGKAEQRRLQDKAWEYYIENVNKMNRGQTEVFKAITQRIQSNEGGLCFLEAPGGTGKTFLLNLLINWIWMNEGTAAATAATGIAATLLHGGRTTHNTFKLPIPISKIAYCRIKPNSKLAESLREVDVIIIDEGPMLEKNNFECLDRSLRDIADPDKAFGGKLVLVCGDFRQLLPIIVGGNRAPIVGSTLKKSKLWDDVMILGLTENMRVLKLIAENPNEAEFHQELLEHAQWLLDLGEGKLPPIAEVPITGESVIEIPQSMARDERKDVIDEIFGDLRYYIGDKQYLKSRMILAADNEIVNETNLELVKKLPGEMNKFKSVDNAVDDEGGSLFPAEYLNTQNPSGIAEHELNLKVNSVVILLRNMNIPAGHCNGTRYIVKAIGKYRLVLEKLDADFDDEDKILILPRIPMVSNESSTAFKLKRLQFPVKLAFAVTFNRAQGQSVGEKCGILLPKKIWTHGQIYVAFSRCGNPRNIFVWADQLELLKKYDLPKGKKYLTNVVYKEVLH